MMTTPRLVSLTALAASLFIIVLTITQANGFSATSHTDPSATDCLISECEVASPGSIAKLQR